MSPKERVLAIFNRQETDKAAVINPTSVLTVDSMKALGLSCPDVHLDADKMAAAAAAGHELCGFDSVMPKFSVVHSAAALGAEVDWNSGDAMPVIRKHPITDPDQFKMPSDFLDHYAIRVVLDAIQLLKKRYRDKIVIIGKVFGPWTTAYNMCGTQEFLMETVDDPEKAARYLEIFTPPPILFAEAQYEAGADIILWGDHVSGDLCSPIAYKELLLPIHQKINGGLLKKKGPVIHHACGRTIDRAQYFAESGFEAFHFDSRNNTKEFLEKVNGKILLTGGITNNGVLYKGRPEQVRAQVIQLLDDGIRLISPECAIPMQTPNENLQMIRKTVDEYFEEKRAG
jgi:[methyl-Co(III) methanol-specific corrinoid protein]:coenzyme M methyltransferase